MQGNQLKPVDTVDVLDIHGGLGLQQQGQQLRGAGESGVVQRREAVDRGRRRGQGWEIRKRGKKTTRKSHACLCGRWDVCVKSDRMFEVQINSRCSSNSALFAPAVQLKSTCRFLLNIKYPSIQPLSIRLIHAGSLRTS